MRGFPVVDFIQQFAPCTWNLCSAAILFAHNHSNLASCVCALCSTYCSFSQIWMGSMVYSLRPTLLKKYPKNMRRDALTCRGHPYVFYFSFLAQNFTSVIIIFKLCSKHTFNNIVQQCTHAWKKQDQIIACKLTYCDVNNLHCDKFSNSFDEFA
jgi:hypothetical protein